MDATVADPLAVATTLPKPNRPVLCTVTAFEVEPNELPVAKAPPTNSLWPFTVMPPLNV